MKKLLTLAILAVSLLQAHTLHLQKGYIKAHTEVLGDSSINPATSRVHTALNYSGNISSIKGKVWIYAKSLHSDNKKRDEHMYETLDVKKYPKIVFDIQKVQKISNAYRLTGTLKLHGKSKRVSIPAKITKTSKGYKLNANFSIKMSSYGIKPPKLLFLSVRDRVDITVYLNMK